MRTIVLGLVLAVLAFAQTKPAFEVASIRPAAPLDMAKIMAAVQAGQSPKMGQTACGCIERRRARHAAPVLALLVGKGGPKLREATGTPLPLDENTPLKPGEVKVDSVNGPLHMTMAKDGSATVNMGARGALAYRTDPATQAMHLDGDMLTMSGFADMLTQFSQLMGGTALQFVDMTGLTGHYQIKLDISQAERHCSRPYRIWG